MFTPKISRTVLAVIATGMIGGAGAASADDMAATWTELQQAVVVAELCRDIVHDRAAWAMMGPKIDAMVNHEIGGGERLSLIESAKSEAWNLVHLGSGCEGDEAQALLAKYDELTAQ